MTTDPTPTWDEFASTIGRRLREARERSGLSQEKLAKRANLATFTYQKLEKGLSRPDAAANPRLTTLMSLCRALDLGIDELLAGPWPNDIPAVGDKN